ncbi:RdgB/HAM1 family non-canonical purine NTP pyrophosphatase [Flammeovirgaceae bacterium KN852]|uniref:dITP/XTP pyrophosphatase n=2 Tax=Marinigracilibium pacificum TaxID=2729599 RepID=A0A848ISK6_9BACT|nr:RdgB/HAM1 family non-canonical purine NTP pyrophosphatase [Marinigracilibium pacificum]NMM47423.1 RdgB/HAM1 family non-canonical purine NTP pyrophosphatase [Marinigracilibium pacificum]
MKICFATNNHNKVKEVQALLGDKYHLITLDEAGVDFELREDYDTLEANSKQKAEQVYEIAGVPVFADDTGLEVEALNGAPGVYSARYAGEQKNDKDNIKKLLNELGDSANRSARFRTVITLILEGEVKQFEGVVEGVITQQESGEEGFGYDPVFVPENKGVTFAEMTASEKNEISHRGRAVNKLVDYLKSI